LGKDLETVTILSRKGLEMVKSRLPRPKKTRA
jgi:hypothetical protein